MCVYGLRNSFYMGLAIIINLLIGGMYSYCLVASLGSVFDFMIHKNGILNIKYMYIGIEQKVNKRRCIDCSNLIIAFKLK